MAHTLAYLRFTAAVTHDVARLATGLRVSALTGRDSHPLDRYSKFHGVIDHSECIDHPIPSGLAVSGQVHTRFP